MTGHEELKQILHRTYLCLLWLFREGCETDNMEVRKEMGDIGPPGCYQWWWCQIHFVENQNHVTLQSITHVVVQTWGELQYLQIKTNSYMINNKVSWKKKAAAIKPSTLKYKIVLYTIGDSTFTPFIYLHAHQLAFHTSPTPHYPTSLTHTQRWICL